MCGIAGVLCLSPESRVDESELRAMAAALQHRGPDDEGYYLDAQGRCGLAFRRLAIIDLATGNQPILNESGDVAAVLNGEIYNFRELRDELRRDGHEYRTQGDAESVVHLYEQFGANAWERLHGMFAAAIWDAVRGELWLVRDRFGKKPLAYALHDQKLYFASEAKAILALPHTPRRIDPQAVHEYLLFQYVPAPHSIFYGFGKLSPGCALRVEAGADEISRQRAYWRPPTFAGGREVSEADVRAATRELEERLAAAVERRLISDVPLGAFLSGGLDSSLIVATMHRAGVSPLRTFSIGFDDPRYDETEYARLVAARFGTEHH
ncbi:MAG: asparagine synthase (glutamine-hydrolyzing), partial [Planctomycetota bacterium]